MADKKNLMTPVLPFFSILAFLRTVSNISQASNSTFSFKWNKHIPLISVKNVFFCNSVAHFLPFLVLQLSYSFLTLASIVLKHLKLIKKNKKTSNNLVSHSNVWCKLNTWFVILLSFSKTQNTIILLSFFDFKEPVFFRNIKGPTITL